MQVNPPLTRPPRNSPPGPYEQLIQQSREQVRRFYDTLEERKFTGERWLAYYRRNLARLLKHLIRPGSSVLDVGCGNGDLLAAVQPRTGVGIDASSRVVRAARRRHPGLTFIDGFAESVDELAVPEGPYEYVMLVNVIGEMYDIRVCLRHLHRFCTAETRLIVVQYNYLWEPICRMAGWIARRSDSPLANWLALRDLAGLMHLCGYETIREGHLMPLPIRVPGLNAVVNSFLGRLWGFRALGFLSYSVVRPIMPMEAPEQYTCSVVVPCKNEQDNIEGLARRIPDMGAGTEIIFVDDQSTDQTAANVQAAIRLCADRRIRLVQGPGQGKGAAVRAGFADATGDVLMILDADSTVMPEELPAFFDALTSGRGEFINGSRMVYPLAEQAMRLLNVLGNKVFAGLFSLLLDQRIRDTLCGTKVIWRRDYAKILAAREYFGSCDVWGDYDWIFGAAKNHLKIVEIPVHYRERSAGASKMTRRLRNAWVMLKMCGIAFRKLRWI